MNQNKYTLLIKPVTDAAKQFYKDHMIYHEGDSGLDLYVPEDTIVEVGETILLNLQIQCEMIRKDPNGNNENVSYFLMPRSSIYKTPLIMHNSLGLIDAGYRGNLKVPLMFPITPDYLKDVLTKKKMCERKYIIKKGTRLVQIVGPTTAPMKFELVETLSNSSRGSGGFGSTG